jgi:ABC-type branched-subunit amino acid transport system permease subunit
MMKTIQIPKIVLPLVLLVILAAYPLIEKSQYSQHIMVMTLMSATLASSWNIIGGYAGYTSLGHAAFFGLGGYLVALTHNQYGWHPFVSAWLLALIVSVVALVMGWIALRTQGSAFVVVTIATIFIFRLLALNLSDITNGARGLTQPRPGWDGTQCRRSSKSLHTRWLACARRSCLQAIRQSSSAWGAESAKARRKRWHDTMLYKVLAWDQRLLHRRGRRPIPISSPTSTRASSLIFSPA